MFANVRTTLTTLAFLACACIATGSYVKAYGDRPFSVTALLLYLVLQASVTSTLALIVMASIYVSTAIDT